MIHGAILRTDRLLNEAREAEPFTGDAVMVFTTDGIQVKGKYLGERSPFYKNDKNSLALFYAAVMDMIGEKMYEMIGGKGLIRVQNATLLRMNVKERAEEQSRDEKNV